MDITKVLEQCIDEDLPSVQELATLAGQMAQLYSNPAASVGAALAVWIECSAVLRSELNRRNRDFELWKAEHCSTFCSTSGGKREGVVDGV